MDECDEEIDFLLALSEEAASLSHDQHHPPAVTLPTHANSVNPSLTAQPIKSSTSLPPHRPQPAHTRPELSNPALSNRTMPPPPSGLHKTNAHSHPHPQSFGFGSMRPASSFGPLIHTTGSAVGASWSSGVGVGAGVGGGQGGGYLEPLSNLRVTHPLIGSLVVKVRDYVWSWVVARGEKLPPLPPNHLPLQPLI